MLVHLESTYYNLHPTCVYIHIYAYRVCNEHNVYVYTDYTYDSRTKKNSFHPWIVHTGKYILTSKRPCSNAVGGEIFLSSRRRTVKREIVRDAVGIHFAKQLKSETSFHRQGVRSIPERRTILIPAAAA